MKIFNVIFVCLWILVLTVSAFSIGPENGVQNRFLHDPADDITAMQYPVFHPLGNASIGDIVDSIPFPPGVTLINGLAWNNGALWATDFNNHLIYKLNGSTGAVLLAFPAPNPIYPSELAHDGTNLWYLDFGTRFIYKINPATGTVLDSFPDPVPADEGLTCDGTYLWRGTTDTLVRIDPATGAVVSWIPGPGAYCDGLTWDGYTFWFNSNDGNVYQINPTNGAVLQSFASPLGDGNGLAFDGLYLRYDNSTTQQIYSIDIEFTLPPDIDVSPSSFTFSVEEGGSDNDLLVVSNVGQDTLNWSISDQDATLLLNDGQELSVDLRSVNLQRNYPKGVESDPASLNKASSKDGTASYGGIETTQSVFKPRSNSLASTLVIGTTDIDSSVIRAMDSLGVAYDYMSTDTFTTIDFSPYSTILIGMDGGAIDSTSVEAVTNAAGSGKKLIMLGGTNYPPYYAGMQTYLLQHNGTTGWVISSSPHLTVTAPGHPLAQDLPSPYDYANPSASYYMLRITDPAATVVAVNGDGFPALVTKSIGDGTLIYSVSSAYSDYYLNDPDFQVLKTIIRNALNYSECPWLTENVLSGSIPPGGLQNVGIFVDATGLTAGTYDGNLLIASNDPDEPLVTVPVHLTVTPSVGIKDNEGKIPTTYDISPNYPNPFNPTTTIKYQLPQTAVVQIGIYNLLGQSIRTLLNNKTEPGYYEAEWNGLDDAGNQVASGIYIYRIQAGDFMKSRKMILLK